MSNTSDFFIIQNLATRLSNSAIPSANPTKSIPNKNQATSSSMPRTSKSRQQQSTKSKSGSQTHSASVKFKWLNWHNRPPISNGAAPLLTNKSDHRTTTMNAQWHQLRFRRRSTTWRQQLKSAKSAILWSMSLEHHMKNYRGSKLE